MKALLRSSILAAAILGGLAAPELARAFTIRGVGEAALVGGDLTDPENDGDPEANPPVNYNATFSSSEEPGFGNGTLLFQSEAAFNVFDNKVNAGGNDKWCCGDQGNYPVSPLFIDATFSMAKVLRHFTLTSGNDAPDRDPLVWEVQGSNDGINFTTIYARDNATTSVWTARNQVVEFIVGVDYALPAAYTTFRFTVSKTQSTFQLSEIEYFDTPAQSLTVTTVADENDATADPLTGTGTSLREAITYAGTLTGPQTITFSDTSAAGGVNFSDGTARTITLGGTELIIASDLTIIGPGAKRLSVSANHASNVFAFDPGKTAALSGLTIKDGVANSGGGIVNNAALTLQNCMITGNSASSGSGIFNANGATLTIRGSTVSGNSATNRGGIINFGALTIQNSTIAGNSGELSGAIDNSGTLTIQNSTVTGNSAASGATQAGGIVNTSGVSLTFENSIVAGNTGDLGSPDVYAPAGHAITSNGFNFIGDTTGISGGLQAGDKTFASTMTTLAGLLETATGVPVLKDNGGATFTIALVPGSPALDAGDPNFDPNSFTPALTADQRGGEFSRVIKGKPASANATVDIGAFEVQVITFAPGIATNGVSLDASDALLDLNSATIGATPAGGTFSGPGVDANGIFRGDLLAPGSYTITYTTTTPDAYGNTGSAFFTITITAGSPYMRIVATAGPGGTGIDVPGEPVGTKFTQLGLASMDTADTGMKTESGVVGARVRIKPPTGPEVPAIFQGFAGGGLPVSGVIVVRGGDPAPTTLGTLGTFASFDEPVFGAGFYAFRATRTGAGITKANDTGLWSSLSGQLSLVAAEGGAATDVDGNPLPGVTFDQIQSYVLSDDGTAVTFLARVKGTGVKGTNNLGVWQYTPTATRLVFRTGDLVSLSGGPRAVKSLKLFVPAKTIPGQRRSYASGSKRVMAFATFPGGREALLGWFDVGSFRFTYIALENTNVGHPGLPSLNSNGVFAMAAGLSVGAPYSQRPGKVTAKDDKVILVGSGSFNIDIHSQEGSPVSPTNPEVFTAFDEPAFNDNFNTAFFARVKAPGLPASQQRVLIYDGARKLGFGPAVLARTGVPAADLQGVNWKEFIAMALPNSDYGPVFLARLDGPGVTKTNSLGLWATDLDGTVRLLVRTGDAITVNGSPKTVSLINTLGAALDSPGQGRYVDLLGNVSATLTFTDGTTALVYFGMPTVER